MCVVAPPNDYRLASGRLVLSAEITLRARSMTMQRPHPAYQATGAACTAVAALLEGTVVHSAARAMKGTPVAIGHPSGVMRVDAVVDDRGGAARVLRAAQERTARRLMEGFAYVPISRLSAHA
jgi:2-methylaconitate cis-trans-isomerase PrpF